MGMVIVIAMASVGRGIRSMKCESSLKNLRSLTNDFACCRNKPSGLEMARLYDLTLPGQGLRI